MAKPKKHNLSFTEEETTGKRAEKLKEDIKKSKTKQKPKKEMKVKEIISRSKTPTSCFRQTERQSANVRAAARMLPKRDTGTAESKAISAKESTAGSVSGRTTSSLRQGILISTEPRQFSL